MTPLSLQRQAPVAPGVAECRLRDAPIAGTWQDHLLAGQPDTIQLAAAIPLLATVHHSALLPPAEWTGRSRP